MNPLGIHTSLFSPLVQNAMQFFCSTCIYLPIFSSALKIARKNSTVCWIHNHFSIYIPSLLSESITEDWISWPIQFSDCRHVLMSDPILLWRWHDIVYLKYYSITNAGFLHGLFWPTMFFRKNIFVKLVHIYIENVSRWVSYYKVWSRIKKVMYLLIETIIIYFVTSKNILWKVFLFGECIYYYLTNMYCVYWSKHCNWTPSFTNTEKSAQNRDVAGIPERHLFT